MSLILESDIIYSILPHVCISTIGKLLCVNKFVNKLCNDKYFWKEKGEKDYKNMILKSDEWVMEYKCIYETHIWSNRYVDNFVADEIKYYQNNSIYRFTHYDHSPVNIDYFCWVSEISLLKSDRQVKKFMVNMDPKTKELHIQFVIYHNNIYDDIIYTYLSYDQFKKHIAHLYYYYDLCT